MVCEIKECAFLRSVFFFYIFWHYFDCVALLLNYQVILLFFIKDDSSYAVSHLCIGPVKLPSALGQSCLVLIRNFQTIINYLGSWPSSKFGHYPIFLLILNLLPFPYLGIIVFLPWWPLLVYCHLSLPNNLFSLYYFYFIYFQICSFNFKTTLE